MFFPWGLRRVGLAMQERLDMQGDCQVWDSPSLAMAPVSRCRLPTSRPSADSRRGGCGAGTHDPALLLDRHG